MRVSAEKLKDTARMDNFRIELNVPVELSQEHRDGLEHAVHRCLIHNTLLNPSGITIEIKSAALSHA